MKFIFILLMSVTAFAKSGNPVTVTQNGATQVYDTWTVKRIIVSPRGNNIAMDVMLQLSGLNSAGKVILAPSGPVHYMIPNLSIDPSNDSYNAFVSSLVAGATKAGVIK